MKYIHFNGGTGYCGCDFEDVVEFDDDVTEEEISAYGNELARDNGETFEYCATGWEADFVDGEDKEAYYEDCWFNWDEISEEQYKYFQEFGYLKEE